MKKFNQIKPLPHLFEGEPDYVKPKLVGFYSVNASQEFVEDLSELRYMVKKPGSVYLDLTYGDENAKPKEWISKHLPFFNYLLKHDEILEEFESSSMDKVGFVLNRGAFNEIGEIPYKYNSEVKLSAHLVNGVIYLKNIREQEDRNVSSRWGHKFRQYLLSSSSRSQPETDEPVNEDKEFIGIFKMKLKNHNILYKSEIDGILANEEKYQNDIDKDLDEKSIIDELNTKKFIKLKSSVKRVEDFNFRKHNSRNTWLKCFYSNSEELYIGYKNKNAVVEEIANYSLEDLKNMGNEFWNTDVMLNFTGEVLTFIKNSFMQKIADERDIKTLPEMTIYFKFTPRQTFKVCAPPSKDSKLWLPEWYIDKKNHKE